MMIVGFNHNIAYRGTDFHVQTEDSGLQKPQLVTLLYHGGTIISSKKTVYADIIKVDNLEQVVEELAKEQHKGMLKELTRGEFDDRIAALGISLQGSPDASPDTAAVSSVPVTAPETEIESIAAESPTPVAIVEEPIVDKFNKPQSAPQTDLDELIYAYLTAGQKSS